MCVRVCVCVCFCVISKLYTGGKKNTADSRTKQTEHTRAKSAHIYKEAEKKLLLEPGNKGSQDNGGEADKSRRPQETGRITMPAECADQLGNTAKKCGAPPFCGKHNNDSEPPPTTPTPTHLPSLHPALPACTP